MASVLPKQDPTTSQENELKYPPKTPSPHGNDSEDEEIEEQIHLSNVIQTFEQYGPYAVSLKASSTYVIKIDWYNS